MNIKINTRNTKSTPVLVRHQNTPDYHLARAKNTARQDLRRLWREYRQSRLMLKRAKLDYKISKI